MSKVEQDLKVLTDFCDQMGFTYTIDRNPSKDKIAKIESFAKSKEELMNAFSLISKRGLKNA